MRDDLHIESRLLRAPLWFWPARYEWARRLRYTPPAKGGPRARLHCLATQYSRFATLVAKTSEGNGRTGRSATLVFSLLGGRWRGSDTDMDMDMENMGRTSPYASLLPVR